MKKLILSSILLSIALPFGVQACKNADKTTAQRYQEADGIYIVRSLSQRVPQLADSDYLGDSLRESMLTSQLNKEQSLMVYETVKGHIETNINADIDWCGGGEIELGHVGVAYKTAGKWYLEQGSKAVQYLKKISRE